MARVQTHSIFLFLALQVGRGLKLPTQASEDGAAKPKTAILIAGLMRNWDRWDGEWIKFFMKGMVEPNNADIFIHTTEFSGETRVPLTAFRGDIKERSLDPREVISVETLFGHHLKEWKNRDQPNPPQSIADIQFWHLEKAWKMMAAYEETHDFKYDIVIKTRTEIAPNRDAGAILDLAGWEEKGKIHMATDMLFWGQRDDMEKVYDFYSSIQPYYREQYPDPVGRPIHVKELLETYERDPRYSNKDPMSNWHSYNKMDTLPYPDMGLEGPEENLRAALDAGIDVCINGKGCTARPGDRGSGGDYTYGEIRCEKDILDHVLQAGMVICDVGKSMHSIFFKGNIEKRQYARDC